MDKMMYLTTPIYYVNDKPHIGHAYTTVLTDVISRYRRMMSLPVFLLTGTDEHGQKVKRAAEVAGCSPQEQADTTVKRFLELWDKLDISYDDFIRTTQPRHKIIVKEILEKLYEKGDIYKNDYDGWYCVPCERFYTEKDLIEDKCPDCTRTVEKLKESNYFFKMSAYQDWLIEYIESNPGFILPEFRKNETLGFLKKPLNDLCISRPKSRLEWGIELPFDKEYTTYVWFDALVNYISAAGYRKDEEKFSRLWPAIHFIGKDILTTHTVYWPIMLKAIELPMPRTVFAHGWWLLGKDKMSKSTGKVVNPMDMIELFGADPFRYFLIAEMAPGQDASFSELRFRERYNSDLANELGNLLSRVISMIIKYKSGFVHEDNDVLEDMNALVNNAALGIKEKYECFALNAVVEKIWDVIKYCNLSVEKYKPWILAKEDHILLDKVLSALYYSLCFIAFQIEPLMPEKAKIMKESLGISENNYDSIISSSSRLTFEKIKKTGSLFPKYDA